MRSFAPENYILGLVVLVAFVGVGSLFFHVVDLPSFSLTGYVVGAAASSDTSNTSTTFHACTDTDGGVNVLIQGTVSDSISESVDYCISDRDLREYSCVDSTTYSFNDYNCRDKIGGDRYYCQDGACYWDNNKDGVISSDEEESTKANAALYIADAQKLYNLQQQHYAQSKATAEAKKEAIAEAKEEAIAEAKEEEAAEKHRLELFPTIYSFFIIISSFSILAFIFVPFLKRHFQIFRVLVIIATVCLMIIVIWFIILFIQSRDHLTLTTLLRFSSIPLLSALYGFYPSFPSSMVNLLYIFLIAFLLFSAFFIVFGLYVLFCSSQPYKKRNSLGVFSVLGLLLFSNYFEYIFANYMSCSGLGCLTFYALFVFLFIPLSPLTFLFMLLGLYFFGIITPDTEKDLRLQQKQLSSFNSLGSPLFHVNYHPTLGRFLEISAIILVINNLYFMITEGIIQGLLPELHQNLDFFSILSFLLFILIFATTFLVLFRIFSLGSLFLNPEEKTLSLRKITIASALFLCLLSFFGLSSSLISLLSSNISFSASSFISLFDIFGSLLFIFCSVILCHYYLKYGE